MQESPEQQPPTPQIPQVPQVTVAPPVAVTTEATPTLEPQAAEQTPLPTDQLSEESEEPSDETADQTFVSSSISWTAAEYVEHDKNRWWYVIMIVATIGLIAVAIFLFRDWIFAVLVVVMAIAIYTIAHRPAREIVYTITPDGINIGEKHFNFSTFRAFGLVKEGAIYNLRFVPNKRFMPHVTAYIPNEQGEQIVDTLGAILPMEDIQPDIIDSLVSRSRI